MLNLSYSLGEEICFGRLKHSFLAAKLSQELCKYSGLMVLLLALLSLAACCLLVNIHR